MSGYARRRKDYRIAPPERLSSSPDPQLRVELTDERGELVQRFDFGTLGAPPAMARELALAFSGHCADKSPSVWFRNLCFGHPPLAAFSFRAR